MIIIKLKGDKNDIIINSLEISCLNIYAIKTELWKICVMVIRLMGNKNDIAINSLGIISLDIYVIEKGLTIDNNNIIFNDLEIHDFGGID